MAKSKTNTKDKSGLSAKERKAVKNLIVNMSEPKQHTVEGQDVNLYSAGSGGFFIPLTAVPLNVSEGNGLSDATNHERLGQQILPRSLTVDLHLIGSVESQAFRGKTIDMIRVVLLRYKDYLQTFPSQSTPTQQQLWGDQLPFGASVLTKPLDVFNNKALEILHDEKITLTGDMDQWWNTTGLTMVEHTNSPQHKTKLLRLKVPYKEIIKKMKFDDANPGTQNYAAGSQNQYFLYLVHDGLSYGAPIAPNDPTFSYVSRFNYRDIGA